MINTSCDVWKDSLTMDHVPNKGCWAAERGSLMLVLPRCEMEVANFDP